ncbi:hypothetical protein GBF38_006757 [Nibea albiflora]|uniref:Uncharacterized protein n=1 Tax=Nibea albiflora TaxID=240163 RepID=A0ACB7EGN0_NIBAL|nr:hypothetical protein GBF38_006757 [Nibea albiflora]
MTHDISLDEFEDDDLSEITEITDECGMSLNCNGPDLKLCVITSHVAAGAAPIGREPSITASPGQQQHHHLLGLLIVTKHPVS